MYQYHMIRPFIMLTGQFQWNRVNSNRIVSHKYPSEIDRDRNDPESRIANRGLVFFLAAAGAHYRSRLTLLSDGWLVEECLGW